MEKFSPVGRVQEGMGAGNSRGSRPHAKRKVRAFSCATVSPENTCLLVEHSFIQAKRIFDRQSELLSYYRYSD
jgi:hypothetical protein